MEAFFTSAFSVALSELGDKTQLLAILLVCRFRKPIPIILGMIIATVANHLLAGYIGELIANWVSPQWIHWIVAASFFAVAIWMLVPDKIDDGDETKKFNYGPFLTTLVLFFLAEIGDKTQIATMLMAAKYSSLWEVVSGSTLGVCLANIPVIFISNSQVERLPMNWIRRGSCLLFMVLGVLTLLNG